MNRSLRRASTIAALAAMLYGCSFSTGVPNAPFTGASSLKTKTGDLLYVANARASDGVNVLTFPQGTPVATIKDIGTPYGMCSDTSGNVWVIVYDSQQHAYYLIKFAHGGTKPVERLTADAQGHGYVDGCAVDPTSGDLAGIGVFHNQLGAEIWRGAKGKPVFRSIPFEGTSCGYDNKGNLFITGIYGSTFDFYFGELPKGGTSKFEYIHFNRYAFGWPPGSVQWDGKYMTVGVVNRSQDGWRVFRVQISGTEGKVVGVVHLADLSASPHYDIVGDKIVATVGKFPVRRIGLYDYPDGGSSTQLYSSFHKPVGVTVSVQPK